MNRLLLRFALATGVLSAQDSDLAVRAVKVLEQKCRVCHGPSLAQSGLQFALAGSSAQGRHARSGASSRATRRRAEWCRRFAEPASCDAAGPEAPRRRNRHARAMDRGRRGVAKGAGYCQPGSKLVVVPEAGAPGGSGDEGRLGSHAGRRLHPEEADRAETEAGAGSRPAHADSPRLPRSARTAAHGRAGREVRQRSRARTPTRS